MLEPTTVEYLARLKEIAQAGPKRRGIPAAKITVGIGTCGIAAYEQDELDQFLGLDGKDEFVIYLAPVGKVGREQEE